MSTTVNQQALRKFVTVWYLSQIPMRERDAVLHPKNFVENLRVSQ